VLPRCGHFQGCYGEREVGECIDLSKVREGLILREEVVRDSFFNRPSSIIYDCWYKLYTLKLTKLTYSYFYAKEGKALF